MNEWNRREKKRNKSHLKAASRSETNGSRSSSSARSEFGPIGLKIGSNRDSLNRRKQTLDLEVGESSRTERGSIEYDTIGVLARVHGRYGAEKDALLGLRDVRIHSVADAQRQRYALGQLFEVVRQ